MPLDLDTCDLDKKRVPYKELLQSTIFQNGRSLRARSLFTVDTSMSYRLPHRNMGFRILKTISLPLVLITLSMSCLIVVLNSTWLLDGVQSIVTEIPTLLSQDRQTRNSSKYHEVQTKSVQIPLKNGHFQPYKLVFDPHQSLPYFHSNPNNLSVDHTTYKNRFEKHINESRQKSILLYERPRWLFMSRCSGGMSECPVSCTCSENPDDVTRADAVVIYGVELPWIKPRRRFSQAWVFFGLEAPLHYSPRYKLTQWQHAFNWTMTYRLDSDVVVPYSVLTMEPETNKNFTDIALSKSKHAAWLVSNCNTQSKREQYVKTLQEYYSVDIFGNCGPRGRIDLKKFEVLKDFRFYLAFENSLCVDYITEKFFELFDRRLEVIPIVRGGADYRKLVPNGTYINTADFPGPRELAGYLRYLERNVTAYADLLRQKDMYVTKGFDRSLQSGFCDLCMRLNDDSHSPPSGKGKWLRRNACRDPVDI